MPEPKRRGTGAVRETSVTSSGAGTSVGLVARARQRLAHLAADASHDGIARRTAAFAFAVRVASAAIAYIAQIVLARWMGTFEYGIYVFVWTWVLILGSVSGLGFGVAAGRFVPEHQEKKEPDLLRGFLRGSRAYGLAAGTVFAALGIAIILLLGDKIESHFVWPLILALICLPFFAVTETQDGIARTLDAPGIALVPPYILRPLLLLALMILTHEAGLAATATVALLCAIVATWLTALVQFVALARHLGRRVPAGPRRFASRYWLAASLPLFVADGAHVMLLNVDVLILAFFVPPDQVGIYFAVTKTLVLGAFVAFAVGAAVAHRYAEYHVSGDRERLQAFVLQSAQWTFWPTLAAVALMVLLGRPFLALFGPSFVEGYPLMLILSLGVLLRAAVGPTDRLLAVLGEQTVLARLILATLLVAIALHVLLVSLYGVTGAAIAVALTTLVEGGLLAWAAHRRLGLKVGVWHRAGATPR
jgi:O-antigen/teichoic acid export membrane protein